MAGGGPDPAGQGKLADAPRRPPLAQARSERAVPDPHDRDYRSQPAGGPIPG